jgi:hypothetical protein
VPFSRTWDKGGLDMHEPSKELREQILNEFNRKHRRISEITAPKDAQKEWGIDFRKSAIDYLDPVLDLPTINKALELYEMIPDEMKEYCLGHYTICPFLKMVTYDSYDKEYRCCCLPNQNFIDAENGYIKFPDCPRPYKGA